MAAKKAAYGQPRSVQDAVLLQRKPRVLGAGRREPAGARQQGRDEVLIRRDRPDRDAGGVGHGREPGIAASASPSSLVSVANGARSDAGRPMITRAAWEGAAARATRYASRNRRRARLRWTAPRTCRLTAKPARRGSAVALQSTIMDGRSIRLPRWKSAWIAALVVNRSRRGKRPVRRSAVSAPSRDDA